MLEGNKDSVILILTKNQRRFLKTFMGIDLPRLVIPITAKPQPPYGVGIPPPENKAKILLLTAEQSSALEKIVGQRCDFIELERSLVKKWSSR
ncbi:MAG: hypothetical protein ACFFCW_07215 [Candidatus Hodarchaeota archaeon]